jgi:uncharacterized membrane protein
MEPTEIKYFGSPLNPARPPKLGRKPNRKVLCKTMNILSLLLAVVAVVIFALTSQGHKYATISLGLAVLTTAWILQLLWASAEQITL